MSIERVVQVAVRAQDLDTSVAFYRDVLGLRLIARFDPPGLAFMEAGGLRILLERAAAPATLYYAVADIDGAVAELSAKGLVFDSRPHLIYTDTSGLFGPAGVQEWMAFTKDPGGNIVGLVERRPSLGR